MQNTHKYNYMVVEDERLIRQNLIKKIENLNLPLHMAGEAANGADAITLIQKNCPDLVITDIRMPQCDGLELARFLYKNYPSVKIVILSGYNDFSYAQTAIKYAVKDYLLKPVTTEALSESLQKLLITMSSESEHFDAYQVNNNALDQRSIFELLEKYLQENYRDDISFQELADRFGFTQEYLGRIFKKYAGETPSKYLTRLRINEAKRLLLKHPDMEIQKIGELVGYKDGFYFSRVFKNSTGIQPSEYRNQK
ncbi:MAG: response regulator [Oliverpabstia sp.]